MSGPLTLKITGNAMKVFKRAARDAKKALEDPLRKSAMQVMRYAKDNVATKLNTTGATRKHSTGGGLRRSITSQYNMPQLRAYVGPSVIYGRIHEFGGVIRPKKAKHLAIPIGTMTGSARSNFGQLRLLVSRRSGLFLIDKNTGALQYVLKKSVTIPARPYLGPALARALPDIERRFGGAALTLLEPKPQDEVV